MSRNLQEQEYRARINRVIDYIQANLSKQLSLAELSKVACFSPYHFHRIFRTLTGETLNGFIQRLRMEKAVGLLIFCPGKSITEIAFDSGFSNSASFARLFKETFAMSASKMRSGGFKEFSKIRKSRSKNCKTNSNNGKEIEISSGYFINHDSSGGACRCVDESNKMSGRKRMSIKDVNVNVKELSPMTVAYVRNIGPYKGNSKMFDALWAKLMKWAGPRGLMNQPDLKMLSIYHDDPEITDENNLRVSVCLTVPPETIVDGEVGKMEIPGGKYAMAHFEITKDEFQDAWDYVFGKWLPDSGYQPDDGPCFELYPGDPKEHPEHKYVIEICVPVKPL